FPSTALAAGVRNALENMGWGPLQQRTVEGEEVVYLGNFGSASYATYAARDLAAQKIATPRVVDFSEGLSFASVGIEGPLIAPRAPDNKDDTRVLSAEEAVRQLGMLADNLPPRIADPARLAVERLAMEGDWSAFGDDAGIVA